MSKIVRRNLIRGGLLILLILLGVFLYSTGKIREIFVDNEEVTAADGTPLYPADKSYLVWIDGQELGTVRPDRRKFGEFPGLRHTVVLEELDENEDPTGKRFSREFLVGPGLGAYVNVPALVNGDEERWLRRARPEPEE
ncbi:MAG: DUF6672 family protein [Bacteroidota bacterium]